MAAMTPSRGPAIAIVVLAAIILGGCAGLNRDERVVLPDVPDLGLFSSARPGDELPGKWRVWTMSRFKKSTDYRMVTDAGRTVMRADASASASGLVHDIRIDPREYPILKWRWKVDGLIAGADNRQSNTEDSPARIVIAFEGDVSKLDFEDSIIFTQIRMLTGYSMPYATLMYIWENKAPIGAVIPSRHTSRVQMVVAESGSGNLGTWREESRNFYEDYKRAFGEVPPMIRSIGIMTDTDNTGGDVHAYYGDIAFMRAPRPQGPPEHAAPD